MKIEMLDSSKLPKLYMPSTIYNQVLNLVNSTDLEMTILFSISRELDNFRINKVLIPPQWNEPAETKTIDSKYPKWCIEQYKNKDNLNGDGHTHPSFSVSPSGYDINYFEQMKKDTNDFKFRFIINQKGYIHCDLIDRIKNLVITDMPVTIICDGFNIEVTDNKFNLILINKKKLKYDIDNSLNIILKSQSISYTPLGISYKKDKNFKYKAVRKSETDEGHPLAQGFKEFCNNIHNKRKLETNRETYIYDDYPEEFDPEGLIEYGGLIDYGH